MSHNTIHYQMYVQGLSCAKTTITSIRGVRQLTRAPLLLSWQPICTEGGTSISAQRQKKVCVQKEAIKAQGGPRREDGEIRRTFFNWQWKSSLWRRHSNDSPTYVTEQQKSDYLALPSHLSGELIYLPPLPSCCTHPITLPRLELVLGKTWLRAGQRRPWWMLKELTPWPMSQQAKNIASKVLCQVEYWFLVLCTLGTTSAA